MNWIFDPETKTHYETNDLIEWATWFEGEDRYLFKTEMDGYFVSTVFLGINHGLDDGAPLLYETMVFSADGFEDMGLTMRYATYDEASTGHSQAVDALRVWLSRQRKDRQLDGAR